MTHTLFPAPPRSATHFRVCRGRLMKSGRWKWPAVDEEHDGVKGAVLHDVGEFSVEMVRDRYGFGRYRAAWFQCEEGKTPIPRGQSNAFEVVARKKGETPAPKKIAKTKSGRLLEEIKATYEMRLKMTTETYEMRLRNEREQFASMNQLQAKFFETTLATATSAGRSSGIDREVLETRLELERMKAKDEVRRELARAGKLRRAAAEEEDDDDEEDDDLGFLKDLMKNENVRNFLAEKVVGLLGQNGPTTPPTGAS